MKGDSASIGRRDRTKKTSSVHRKSIGVSGYATGAYRRRLSAGTDPDGADGSNRGLSSHLGKSAGEEVVAVLKSVFL